MRRHHDRRSNAVFLDRLESLLGIKSVDNDHLMTHEQESDCGMWSRVVERTNDEMRAQAHAVMSFVEI